MDETLFWDTVGRAYRPDLLEQAEALADALGRLKWFEVVDFQAWLERLVAAADTPGLRAAAAVVNGDSTARGFRDFRLGLAASGRLAYEAALRDADSLADFLDGDPLDGFGLDRVAVRVYESQTGFSDFYQRLAERHSDLPKGESDGGDAPTDDVEYRQRLPNLSKLYPAPTEE